MALLSDLIIPGLSVKLRRRDVQYRWDGASFIDLDGRPVLFTVVEMMADDWAIDEPSREDVLKARGYSMRHVAGGEEGGYRTIQPTGPNTYAILTVKKSEAPRTAVAMTRVLDFLDTFKPKPKPPEDAKC